MTRKFVRKILSLIVLVIFAICIGWCCSDTKLIRDIENWTIDLRILAFSPKTKASDDIVMVWLDEASIASLPYRTPIPRDFLTKLNDKIWEANPRLVAYDIFFKDSSFPESDRELARSFKGREIYAVAPMREDGKIDSLLPFFQESLKGVGLSDLPFSAFDQRIRKTKFIFDSDKERILTIPALIYEQVTKKKVDDAIPTNAYDDDGRVLIRFTSPPSEIGRENNRFKVFSAKLVEKGIIPKNWLEGKIVMVGASYADLKDAFITPFYAASTNFAKMNGIEIHTNVLNSLLTGEFYKYSSTKVVIIFTFLAALLIGISSLFFSPWKTLPLVTLLIATEWTIAVILFSKFALLFPVMSPTISILICTGGGLTMRALTEGKEKKFIKGVFAKYVPPTVVERIVEDPRLLKLGGEERIVTSLFSDIASFTTISERLSPTKLVEFLNEYLGVMNDILFKYGATLDKYEGDAIIAFFNAPLDLPEHEIKAILCAIEMQDAGRKISNNIITRIGINTGPAVIGNMGSQGRFDYTAIGDTINLASRLEGTNKFYGTRIMTSERTAIKLDSSIVKRPLDRVRVKGKTESIILFEIMGKDVDLASSTKNDLCKSFRMAFESFEKREFEKSAKVLDDILTRFPDDEPSKILLERCKIGLQNPKMELIRGLEK